MKKVLTLLFTALGLACGPPTPQGPELVLGFVPSQQAESLADDVEPLERYLESRLRANPLVASKYPQIRVRSFVAVKYVGLVASFKAKKVDIGFLAPFSYLLSYRDTTKGGNAGTTPLLRTLRYGASTYRAQIVAGRETGITDVPSISGHSFAFTDAASTSGFLYPSITLAAHGIDYRTDLSNYAMLGSHDNVIQAILRGDFDAGATFEDARNRLVFEHPHVAPGGRLRLAWFPNGVMVPAGLDLRKAELSVREDAEDFDWCPGSVEATHVAEMNYWSILMRYKPPSKEALAESIRPLWDHLSTEVASLLPTPCGQVAVQVMERWEGDVVQIALTTPIPNDIVAARPGLDPLLSRAVQEAFLEVEEISPEIFALLKSLYTIEGFEVTTHADFEELERLAKESGML
ncbi:phosphate/phosphite/phosphonate ABC transporter substrate-binding protein [bacterium]|nr:phosphate/phosphite/phosphonate ABC transporter substrate-binding protein [bacterium]